MTLRASGNRPSSDTKGRILDAAEDLFIEHGFEAMSLRQITSHAEVNLAAVNYHFGSKEALIHSMLARRLDQLNLERLKLLDRFEKRFEAAGAPDGLTCEHVLGALFIPALRLSRDPKYGGRAFLRLLGRAYTDPSSFVREFLAQHYASVSDRLFMAFAHALPHLPREELSWRLNFSIGALSGVLAGSDTERLVAQFSQGEPLSDLQLIARLASLMVAALKAPVPDESSFATFAAVLEDADAVEAEAAAQAAAMAAADAAAREAAQEAAQESADVAAEARATLEQSREIERNRQPLNSSGTDDVNASGDTEAGKPASSSTSAGTSAGSGSGSGGSRHSQSTVVGEPSQKMHAGTGGSRTPISWPGSTTAGSFRYRVF